MNSTLVLAGCEVIWGLTDPGVTLICDYVRDHDFSDVKMSFLLDYAADKRRWLYASTDPETHLLTLTGVSGESKPHPLNRGPRGTLPELLETRVTGGSWSVCYLTHVNEWIEPLLPVTESADSLLDRTHHDEPEWAEMRLLVFGVWPTLVSTEEKKLCLSFRLQFGESRALCGRAVLARPFPWTIGRDRSCAPTCSVPA